ncbi:Lhr family helicase [Kineosporia corallincola]|uniref:Lhr family helicase n=1 Tax=Kineosporia corallincola TaxID=2835133 RepID=UPI001FE2A105|nr:DEAD/DEAH box helicase [Kineosporia corallincola]
MMDQVLERFSPATRAWFTGAFAAPTAAQAGAWNAVSAGRHALVVAPTGSGKTLSAFLWALDRLTSSPAPEEPSHRCRVLYVSPLKALAVDVERNLRSPLAGIRQAAGRLNLPLPEVRVALRSGDTPADERRAFTRTPPDVLITTPESLFLLLTSKAREMLAGVETVIIDEVHAVAGSKRGAHLALSLERLDALLERPAQRVGLSATVRPIEEIARWLGGRNPVEVVQPPSTKQWDLEVVVPVADMAELDNHSNGVPGAGADPGDDLTGAAAGAARRPSIWPHVEERIVDLIAAHRSTLVFANSRRLAERLTARLNEIWTERLSLAEEELPDHGGVRPAELMGGSGASAGALPVLARAHHGSVSKEQRAIIEGELKAGRLPAVVATSSLELGIDMGAVDLVIQVESPPSVASGLQRVGRAGHQVGAVSQGALFPKYRGDLVQTAVVVERMREGAIEQLAVPASPLDVLAQQIVAMVAMDEWPVGELEDLVRRSAPFASLTRGVLESVLDMLAGRYPSDEFAELRPRLVWDRHGDVLTARPGAQRLAVTSGGTIPDRGLFGVFLAGGDEARKGAGRRVGELDEEMVYESRVGDVFTLGSSAWRIEDITHDRVLVTPAPGQPGRLPFWKGDQQGRPAELGRAVGAYVRSLGRMKDEAARERVRASGLDEWAADNLLTYLAEQKQATGHLPDDKTIVIERFRDEIGDWRVVVHSPFGGQVHSPWALALAARFRERFGVDVQAAPGDDGIVLRLPDIETDDGSAPDVADLIVLEPEDVEEMVTAELGGSALFASRFRECAARALLLPRRQPGKRQPLWQQRQRAAQLLEVASRYGSFPIVLETLRECLQDVFDVPGLESLMRDVRSRSVKVVEVTSQQPSPFARSLLFGYVAQFLYEGDSPLAERRAAALALDPALLAELLGRGEGASLRDLLDPSALRRTEEELQRLAPNRRARTMEQVADLVRMIGPLSTAEVVERTVDADAWARAEAASGGEVSPGEAEGWGGDETEAERLAADAELSTGQVAGQVAGQAAGQVAGQAAGQVAGQAAGQVAGQAAGQVAGQAAGQVAGQVAAAPTAEPAEVARWLSELEGARRLIRVRVSGEERWAAVEDAGRLRDALGTALPVGVAEVFTEPVPDPLGDLLSRYARSHGPFTAQDLATRLGLGAVVVVDGLRRLADGGRLVQGELRPLECGGGKGTDYCDAEVLRTLRRRSLAALRAEVEPVPALDLARFLPGWQGVGGRTRGVDGVLRAVEQLAGAWVPASALETLVIPGRVPGYTPAMLDELTSAGEVVWAGHGSLPGDDGWVSLHPADLAPLTLPPEDAEFEPEEVHLAVLDALAGGGAYFFRALSAAVSSTDDQKLTAALWDLVWAGRISNDTLAALRARLSGGRTTHKTRAAPPRARYGRYGGLRAARAGAGRPSMPSRTGPPLAAGRWSLLPEREPDPTARAHAQAEVLLERHGVVTRGAVMAERVAGGFAAAYRVLSGFEDAGRVRRGYFVEGLGASQFAGTGAVDRLRASARPAGETFASEGGLRTVVLAAADPANPYGAALPWPERPADNAGHRPGRKAGAIVILVDGALTLYVERGGRTLLSWTDEEELLRAAADALALAVREGALGKLTVEKADGEGVLGRDNPLAQALENAGFRATPRGLRLRA